MKRALAYALEHAPLPCRERTDQCAENGECLRCGAAQGETCREPVIVAYRPEGRNQGEG